jgi:hypothetical protein
MTPLNTIVFVPIVVPVLTTSNNGGWLHRTPQPQYPNKRQEAWPLRQSVPQEDARRQLDDARRKIAHERDRLRELAHDGRV